MFESTLIWLFFAYAVGTGFGWYMGTRSKLEDTTELVIDSLIEQGYLKTKGRGKDMQILKWNECDDQDSR